MTVRSDLQDAEASAARLVVCECTRCVLNTSDRAEISFDSDGICNHCRHYDAQAATLPQSGEERDAEFRRLVGRIRREGQGRQYDCVLGLSGGVDSSYLAYLARREGLRPLVVHFDNGWNSELAVNNIHSIVRRLGLDLNTYVIDWEEFRDLQVAYLRASVVDIEVLTDHAIYGAILKLALENDIPFVLSGNNVATEGVLPYAWTYNKLDSVNIRDIHRKFGTGTLKSYPLLTQRMKQKLRRAGTQILTLLDFVEYDKAEVKQVLEKELGWRDYGGKHYESIFTRFYQAFILPEKFGIDKRKAHLSALICSGQITKAAALEELAEPPLPPAQLAADREYVLKKLGLSETEFAGIMAQPPRGHREFEVEGSFFGNNALLRPFRPVWRLLKSGVAPRSGIKRTR